MQLGEGSDMSVVESAGSQLLAYPEGVDPGRGDRACIRGGPAAPPGCRALVFERTCDYGHSDPQSR